MANNLFESLQKAQRATSFQNSEEMRFFVHNSFLLTKSTLWNHFRLPEDSFDVVRANIIIRSLINQEIIEKLYKNYEVGRRDEQLSLEEYMASGMADLPYLVHEGRKIYVPIFPSSINHIYSEDFYRLSTPPYDNLSKIIESMTIDPFDYYGYHLYDSYFSRLIPIKGKGKVFAFYDYDAECIYFVNDQGRLDNLIALFDRGIKKPVKTHMIERVEKVVDAYLAMDRDALLTSLLEEKLVSSSFISSYLGKKGKKEK